MHNMFNVSKRNVTQATDMDNMFIEATSFKRIVCGEVRRTAGQCKSKQKRRCFGALPGSHYLYGSQQQIQVTLTCKYFMLGFVEFIQ